jgi:hypothetical protein
MKNTTTCDRKGLHQDFEIFHARCLGRFFFGISSTPMQPFTCSEFLLIIIVKYSILYLFNTKNTKTCDRKGLHHPGSTPLSIGCTSPIFCSRVRCLNPTSIGLPMSILMSRCKTSKWVRLTAVFKRLKFKQKEKKETFLDGRETTFFGVVLQCSTHYTTLYYFLTVFCSTALN